MIKMQGGVFGTVSGPTSLAAVLHELSSAMPIASGGQPIATYTR